MNKKASASIAVVLLVIFTVLLTTITLYYFNISEQKIQRVIYFGTYLEGVYSDEQTASNYLQDIVDEVGAIAKDETEFISLFNQKIAQTDYFRNKVDVTLEKVIFEKGIFNVEIELVFRKETGENKNHVEIEYKVKKTFINKKT